MPTLHDMLMRYALYSEGARRGVARDFRKLTKQLDTEIVRIVGTRQLEKMTKAEFNNVMVRLRKAVSDILNREVTNLGRTLHKVNDTSVSNFQRIFRRNTGKRKAVDKKRVWGRVNARDIGATGKTIDATARMFQRSTLAEIERQIRIGYTNKDKATDVLARIHGGPRNSLSKIGAWADSLAETSFSHVNSAAKLETSQRYYEEYDWVSVIDEATTEICTERDGNRYRFGDGPLPPAHYRCRSEIIPVDPEDTSIAPQGFGDWLAEQSSEFLSDVFKTSRRDLDNVKLITLDKLRDKLEHVLAD